MFILVLDHKVRHIPANVLQKLLLGCILSILDPNLALQHKIFLASHTVDTHSVPEITEESFHAGSDSQVFPTLLHSQSSSIDAHRSQCTHALNIKNPHNTCNYPTFNAGEVEEKLGESGDRGSPKVDLETVVSRRVALSDKKITFDPKRIRLLLKKQVLVKLNEEAMFRASFLDDLHAVAAESGSEIIGYLPHGCYLVFVYDYLTVQRLRALAGIAWIGDYGAESKLAPEWEPILEGLKNKKSFSHGDLIYERLVNDSHGNLPFNIILPFEGHPVEKRRNTPFSVSHSLAVQWEVAFLEALRRKESLPSSNENIQTTVRLVAVASNIVQATVPLKHLPFALEWFSHQEWVHWLSPQPVTRLHNMYAGSTVQSGVNIPLTNDEVTKGIFGPARAFWKAGILGKNQIVGVGDSGVDLKSCFFQDSSTSIPGLSHRKVVGYRIASGGNGVDEESHGTHVCGSLLGHCLSQDKNSTENSKFNGMAPDAKLFFTDMAAGNVDYIIPPRTMGDDYYAHAYEVGARIHSDSWGTASTTYDIFAQTVDKFTFENPMFLPFVAAGNQGLLHNKQVTITSPALAKNCIAVGATLGAVGTSSKAAEATFKMSIVVPERLKLRIDQPWYPLLEHSYGPSFASKPSKWKQPHNVVRGIPTDGCTELTNAPEIAGNIVLLTRGNCIYATKLRNAQQSKAAAAIVSNTDSMGYFTMAPPFSSSDSITIPGGSIPFAVGDAFFSLLSSGSLLQLSIEPLPLDLRYGPNSMAGFSSWGPTSDGRIKPEITAPGDGIISARYSSDTTSSSCSTSSKSGTSMASPIAAGSAALIRQYFMDGFYPSGKKNPSKGFEPTGMLVKAVMLNGAVHMNGVNGDSQPMDFPPSMNQGFGRVDLLSSLPLEGADSLPLLVREGAPLKTGYGDRFCFLSSPDNANGLKITLVWHDAPALLGGDSTQPKLVNNLHLLVMGPTGEAYWGNGGGEPDNVNNVEQVWIRQPQAGVYVAEIQGYQINILSPMMQGQAFAFAARGPISETPCMEVHANPPPPFYTNMVNLTILLAGTEGPTIQWACKLTRVTARWKVSTWQRCSSPASYENLPDGEYLFQARAEDRRFVNVLISNEYNASFNVNTVPPDTSLLSTSTTSPLSATAAFQFSSSSSDFSYFHCSLTAVNLHPPPEQRDSNPSTPYPSLSTVIPAIPSLSPGGQMPRLDLSHGWENCTSPKQYSGMYDGNYTFSVRAVDLAGNWDTKPPTKSWVLTTLLPAAAITAYPPPFTNNTRPAISFELDSEGVEGVTGRPDWGCFLKIWTSPKIPPLPSGWINNCSSPYIPTRPLSEGRYRFYVRAVPTWNLGFLSNFSASVDFTVDITPPETIFLSKPASVLNSERVKFTFVSSETAEYMCKMEIKESDNWTTSTSWGNCFSPLTYSQLLPGKYRFSLTAKDLAGNWRPINETIFLLDAQAPSIEYAVWETAGRRFNITFLGSDGEDGSGIAAYFCLLIERENHFEEAMMWAPCVSPKVYSELFPGNYTFQVKAADQVGNMAELPYTVEFSVEEDIELQIDVSAQFLPPVPFRYTNQTSASFSFEEESTGRLPSTLPIDFRKSSFECKFPDTDAISNCSNPISMESLSEGEHKASIRIRDREGNFGPWTAYTWTIDTLPPKTSLYSSSSSLPDSLSPTFTSLGNDRNGGSGISHYECQLASAMPQYVVHEWRLCQNMVFYEELYDGVYKFSSRAIDVAGNADLEPAHVTVLISAWMLVFIEFEAAGGAFSEPIQHLRNCQSSASCDVPVLESTLILGKGYLIFLPTISKNEKKQAARKITVNELTTNVSKSSNVSSPPEDGQVICSNIITIAGTGPIVNPMLLMMDYETDPPPSSEYACPSQCDATNEPGGFSLVNALTSALTGSQSNDTTCTQRQIYVLHTKDTIPKLQSKWQRMDPCHVWLPNRRASIMMSQFGSYMVIQQLLVTNSTPPSESQPRRRSSRLRVGAIVGISVGGFLFLLALTAAGVYCCMKGFRAKVEPEPEQATHDEAFPAAPSPPERSSVRLKLPTNFFLLPLKTAQIQLCTETPPGTPTPNSTTAMLTPTMRASGN